MTSMLLSLNSKIQPIDGQYEPATEEEIALAEAKTGGRYPNFFRDLQRTYGRFMFAGDATITCSSLQEELGVFTVFGCKGTSGNLVADFLDHPDIAARRLIPFADDLFNNRYVFDLSTGEVSFIDYARDSRIRPVSNSLDEFFAQIVLMPD